MITLLVILLISFVVGLSLTVSTIVRDQKPFTFKGVLSKAVTNTFMFISYMANTILYVVYSLISPVFKVPSEVIRNTKDLLDNLEKELLSSD